MSKSRWIVGTTPDQPISAVASMALAERFDVVHHYIPLAAHRADDDPYYVHQLRVSSRRARAALAVFRDLLPKQRSKQIKKQLNLVRRAAGDARDLDVLVERLSGPLEERRSSKLARVADDLRLRRQIAQKPLLRLCRDLERQRFTDAVDLLLKRVRWRSDGPEPTLGNAVPPILSQAVEEFFAAAAEDLADSEKLHQMRIAGKRLRYSMELLAGAFPSTFQTELYPIFEDVQDRLGEINDDVTASRLFRDWAEQSKKPPSILFELADTYARLAETEGQEFRNWWTSKRAKKLKHQFDRVLLDVQ